MASNLVSGDTNEALDVFERDRVRGSTRLVSVTGGGAEANNYSYGSGVSADGRHVAFTSWASNLVSDETNG